MVRKFLVLLCLCSFPSVALAANTGTKTATVAAKVPAKVEAKAATVDADYSESVAVEETATTQRTVSVREMPANANGEVAAHNVAVPETFGRVNKPDVKDKLPAFAKPGILGGLALGLIGWIVFEVVKFAALAFAIVWLVRHLWPNVGKRADVVSGKLRQATGIKSIGGVGETVKAFDTAVADLRKKHRAHSGLASFMETRLNQFAAPPTATKTKVKKSNVASTATRV